MTIQISQPSQCEMISNTVLNAVMIIDATNESFCGVIDFIEIID
jgi:hypothetical protein